MDEEGQGKTCVREMIRIERRVWRERDESLKEKEGK